MSTEKQNETKLYELVYDYSEKKDENFPQIKCCIIAEEQYEAIALSLLKDEVELYKFNPKGLLKNVCLLEIGTDGVRNPVWVKDKYPIEDLYNLNSKNGKL